MPGRKYKSVGIREKLYEKIEKEKKEEESISDYIERQINIAKEKEEGKTDGKNLVNIPNEAIGELYKAIGELKEVIASLKGGKSMVKRAKKKTREDPIKVSDKKIKGKDIAIEKSEENIPFWRKEGEDKYAHFKNTL